MRTDLRSYSWVHIIHPQPPWVTVPPIGLNTSTAYIRRDNTIQCHFHACDGCNNATVLTQTFGYEQFHVRVMGPSDIRPLEGQHAVCVGIPPGRPPSPFRQGPPAHCPCGRLIVALSAGLSECCPPAYPLRAGLKEKAEVVGAVLEVYLQLPTELAGLDCQKTTGGPL